MLLTLHGVGCLVMSDSTRIDLYAHPVTIRTNGFALACHLAALSNAACNLVFIHGAAASGDNSSSNLFRTPTLLPTTGRD